MFSSVARATLRATRTQMRAASKKTEDPVKDAFVAKLKEYAKNRDPQYTQKMIKKILEQRTGGKQ